MEDLGHLPQRHAVLLWSEKPLQHVLLLRYPGFLLVPPQHQCQHQDSLLEELPLVPDGDPPGHVEVLGPAPREGSGEVGRLVGERVEDGNSTSTQGGQRLTPVQKKR